MEITFEAIPESSIQSVGILSSLYDGIAELLRFTSLLMLFSNLAISRCILNLLKIWTYAAMQITSVIAVCRHAYLSSKLEIFLSVASQGGGLPPSSFMEEMSARRHLRCRYSDAASRSASAFLSGQLKCFKTAVSSDCRIAGNLEQKKGYIADK